MQFITLNIKNNTSTDIRNEHLNKQIHKRKSYIYIYIGLYKKKSCRIFYKQLNMKKKVIVLCT